jgi:hypothetical protein
MKLRNIITGIAISMFLLIVAIGCEKDQQALLTDGIWHFKNMTTDSEDETTQNIVFLAKALMTDATMEFQEGGDYMINSPLMNEPTTGSWTLIGDDQLILTPEDGVASTANIDVLSKSELIYIETFIDLSQNTYSVTTSWTRK